MSNMRPNTKFSDTIDFLYNFGKYFGLCCYSLTKHQMKYEVSFGTTDFLQLCSIIAVYLTLTYYNIYNKWQITNGAKNTVLFNSGQQLLVRGALLSVLVTIFQMLFMRRIYWEIVNLLIGIDKQMMRLLNIQINHNSLYRLTLIYATISFVAVSLVYASLGYYFFIAGSAVQTILSFILSNAAFVIISIQFQVLIYSLYLRFSVLNGFVESSMLQTTGRLLSPTETLDFQKHLFTIAKITDQLNNVVPKLCYFFGPSMISAFGGLFVSSVFNFNNLYRALIQKNTPQFYLLIFTYDMLSFLFCVWAMLCISVSSFSSSSAKRMGVLVHKIIARTHDKSFILKLKILSQQILHRTPDFSLGIFSLNWSLAYTYVSSVVSYIVILIQFENYIADESTAIDATNS